MLSLGRKDHDFSDDYLFFRFNEDSAGVGQNINDSEGGRGSFRLDGIASTDQWMVNGQLEPVPEVESEGLSLGSKSLSESTEPSSSLRLDEVNELKQRLQTSAKRLFEMSGAMTDNQRQSARQLLDLTEDLEAFE